MGRGSKILYIRKFNELSSKYLKLFYKGVFTEIVFLFKIEGAIIHHTSPYYTVYQPLYTLD